MIARLLAFALLASTASAAAGHPHKAPRRAGGLQFRAAAPRHGAVNGGTEPACSLPDGGAGGTCQLNYYGGAVISNVKAYAVFWGSNVDSSTTAGIAGFFQAVTNHDYMDWLNEYRTDIAAQAGTDAGMPGTQQLIGRGTFGGSYTITPSTVSACDGSANNLLYDDAIANELDAQISAGNLPPADANTFYMIYFPASCQINDGTASNPDSTGNSCQDYCAYHSTALSTRGNGKDSNLYYGIIPDFGPGGGCDIGCGDGAQFDNLTSASSHELIEAVTDAQVGLSGNSFGPPLAWYDESSNEVGDMCNQAVDTITSIIDGSTSYAVQQIYSQKDYIVDTTTACVTTRYEANDFMVFVNPNTATVQAGNSIVVPIQSAQTNGATGAIALTVAGLPAGVTGQLDTAAPATGDGANLTLTAAAGAAPARDAVVVIKGSAGGVQHTAALLLQVEGTGAVGANDFTLSLSAAAAKVAAGNTARLTVKTAVAAGVAETISLGAAGLPAGVTASFNPSSVVAGGTSTMTLSATSGAQQASAAFTVKGKSASVPGGHAATAQVTVDGAPSASVDNPADGATLAGTVSLSGSGSPGAGSTLATVVLLIDSDHVASGAASAAYSWDTTSASNGSHTLAAVATDADDGSDTASVTVTVLNPPAISLTAPAAAAKVSGVYPLAASGTAPKGTAIASLSLLVDGIVVASGPTPLSYNWDTSKVANGAHQVSATATDADGSTATSAAVTVTVANSSGGCASSGSGCGWMALAALGAMLQRVATRRKSES